jgi:phenylacetate-CoA ligase
LLAACPGAKLAAMVEAWRKLLLERAVLPLAGAAGPFRTHRMLQAMLAAEFEPLEAQIARRERLLADLLRHAARETELYAERLAGPSELERVNAEAYAAVPITSKQDLRDGFPQRQLARSYRRAWLRYSNTSGTTGRPLLLIQDVDDISAKYASILRSRVLAGMSPMSSQARITPNECQPTRLASGGSKGQGWFVFLERHVINPYFQRRLMLEPFWGSEQPTLPVDFDRYLDAIDRFAPEVLTLYPPFALLLADYLERTGRKPPPAAGIVDFSGALCTPSMRGRIERAFRRRTAQGCGGCEFARYGASCASDPDRMHLAEDYCYVETVRQDGSPCRPGELGNVVVTSLHSRAMPVIRLEPGDVARIIEEPCGCGRNSRRIEHHGRVHSVMQSADGRWVTDRDVWDRLFAVPGVSLFELRQHDRARYTLRIVPRIDQSLHRDSLDAALVGLLGSQVQASVEEVAALRTQASGKLKLVHSSTYQLFRPEAVRDRGVPVN